MSVGEEKARKTDLLEVSLILGKNEVLAKGAELPFPVFCHFTRVENKYLLRPQIFHVCLAEYKCRYYLLDIIV